MDAVTLDFGTFEVLEVLKQTQYKTVSLARNARTGEKVILRALQQDSEAYQLLAHIRSAHLISVLGVQRVDGTVYAVEEYVNGSLLSDVLEQGIVSRQLALSVALQLCDALEALHGAGIVHRDIKPENILLLPNGQIRLFDYDAARVYNILAGRDTTLMGTVGYAAPEQFGLTQSDARSDIYSLGILLNLLLTGAHPTVKLCRGALRPVVLRCIHVNPERRYQSVRSVRRRFELVQHQNRLLAGAALAAMLVILLAAIGIAQPNPKPTAASPAPPTSSPTFSPTPTPTPETTVLPTPVPSPCLSMPMHFTEQTRSVQAYELDGTRYHLLISLQAQEMDEPDLKGNTQHYYLTEYETTPLFLYVFPEDGGEEAIRRFKDEVESVSCAVLPQTDDAEPLVLNNFGDTLYTDKPLLGSGSLYANPTNGSMAPQHRMATGMVSMKNGDRIQLGYSMTRIPAEVTLSADEYPMNTAAQLNQLLSELDMAYGWNANVPVILQLPETVYTEEVVIQGRAVTLQGTPGGTTFSDGLRITATDDAPITLRGLTFRGDGTGAAITSARDASVISCAFSQHDAAWRAVDGAQFTFRDCIFNVAEPPVRPVVPTTFRYDASQTGLAVGHDALNIPGQGNGRMTIYLTGDGGLTREQASSVQVMADTDAVTVRTSPMLLSGDVYAVYISLSCDRIALRSAFTLTARSADGSINHALDCSYGMTHEGVIYEGEPFSRGYQELPSGTQQLVAYYRGKDETGIGTGWTVRLLTDAKHVSFTSDELPFGTENKRQIQLTIRYSGDTDTSETAVWGFFDPDGVLQSTCMLCFRSIPSSTKP